MDFIPNTCSLKGILSLINGRMGCVCFKPSIKIDGVNYKVLRQVAEGGFSTVDLVEDSRSRKKHALKRITCHSIEDQQVAQREIDIMAKLEHPGIIRLVGFSILGTPDIVHNQTSEVLLLMPFYPRGTLHDDLERRKIADSAYSSPSLLRIFKAVCSAVSALHSLSPPLAHRDIKPHNVLLDRDNSPVLMDLGSVAKARQEVRTMKEAQYLQDTAAERCSMTYRPPELFQVNSNCDIDERTDIWSLGCLLYAMMFYESPFDSVYEKGDSVALAVQGNSINFPSGHSYSQSLLDLVNMMTNQDFTFRPRIDSVISKVEEEMNKDPVKC